MRPLLEKLNAEFAKSHPGVRFNLQLGSARLGVNGLTAEVAAIAPVDRVAWELERRPFRVVFGREPLGIRIGRHGVLGTGRSNPPGVYVNAQNPLAGLTSDQVGRIFATGGAGGDITHWNQAGVTGDFGLRRVHSYGLRDDGGFATNTRLTRMGGVQFSPYYEPFQSAEDVLRAVADDPYGIAFVDFFEPGPISGVKLLPLSKGPGAPFVLPTYEVVRDGHYPFSPYLYLYVNAGPSRPLDPLVADYARLALSPAGQAIIAGLRAEGDGFVPLSASDLASEQAQFK